MASSSWTALGNGVPRIGITLEEAYIRQLFDP